MVGSRGLASHAGNEADRGVAPLIGAILLFGIPIVSWSIYQGVVIPQENEGIEFEHNQKAHGQMLNLRDSVLRTGTSGVQQSSTITVGAEYPNRALAVNFGITGGRIRTREPASSDNNNLTIRNISALDKETRDFLSGDRNLTVQTKSIVYQPGYSHYQTAPDTVIAGGSAAVINEFDATNFSIGDQVLVNGRTITIVAINGSLSKSKSGEGSAITVETKPLSVSTNTVTIENNGSERINITIPTKVDDVSVWNQSTLEDEFGDGGRVHDVKRSSKNHISVILEKGTYTLKMMKVGVGSGGTAPDGKYLTDVETPGGTVVENSSNKIILEVRDTFNNPVDGFQVNATIDSSSDASTGTLCVVGACDSKSTGSTDDPISSNTSNGRVAFNYTAESVNTIQDINLNFTIRSNEFEDYERVWVNTSVVDT